MKGILATWKLIKPSKWFEALPFRLKIWITIAVYKYLKKHEIMKKSRAKRIDEVQEKIRAATLNRERCKIRYDAQGMIIEGHRKALLDLENFQKHLLSELQKSDTAVRNLYSRLKEIVDEVDPNADIKKEKEIPVEIKPRPKRSR
jgi:hypothetical protein